MAGFSSVQELLEILSPALFPSFSGSPALLISVPKGGIGIGMGFEIGLPHNLLLPKASGGKFQVKSCFQIQTKKRCLRCNTLYFDPDNSPTACSFHGHANGEKGLFSLAPPHQGIDGEWTDESGAIVYKWNPRDNRPNTGRRNWKRRWSCCAEYDDNAPPCRRASHVSYDDGFTLY